MDEAATVTPRMGEPSPARAVVMRHSSGRRMGRSLAVGVGGTVLGIMSILIPGLHFVSVWAVPLLSIGLAVHLYRMKGAVGAVTATCPACAGAVDAVGGAWEEPMWIRCSACNAPLELKLERPL